MSVRYQKRVLKYAHAEIAQNEIADQLAKLGAQQAATTNLSHPFTSSEAFKSIKEISSLKWTKRWSHQHNSTEYKLKVPKPGISIIKEISSIAPFLQKQIIRLRLDHTNLPAHKARFIDSYDPLCSTCRCPCDVKHVLLECPKYCQQRTLLIDTLQLCTSSDFRKSSIKNICLKTMTGFESRLTPKERHATLTSLSIFLRNSRANL